MFEVNKRFSWNVFWYRFGNVVTPLQTLPSTFEKTEPARKFISQRKKMNQQASNDMNKTSVAFVEFLELLLLYHFRRNMFKGEIEFFIFLPIAIELNFFRLKLEFMTFERLEVTVTASTKRKRCGERKSENGGKIIASEGVCRSLMRLPYRWALNSKIMDKLLIYDFRSMIVKNCLWIN